MEKKGALQQSLSNALKLQQEGKLNDAEALYRNILLSYPTNTDALSRLGTLNIQLGNFEEAIKLIKASLAVKPVQPDMYNNLGYCLRLLGLLNEALESFSKAIKLNPVYIDAYYNSGVILLELRRFNEALVAFNKAIELNPNHPTAYNNRGVTLWELKRFDEALHNYKKAITFNPKNAEAYNNRAVLFLELKKYDEALINFHQALLLNPSTIYLLGDWLHTKMHLCNWQQIAEGFTQLAINIEMGMPSSTPFPLLAMPLSLEQQLKCTEIYIKNKVPPSTVKLWNGEKYAHDRIRVGYFSSDFHENHPLPGLMAEFFELHDRSKFEVTAFSFGPSVKDAMRTRLENAFEHFIDAREKSDSEIALLARSLEIDIAVNLNGFTANSRTGIFAERPAPIQVSYMGYTATMGAPYMDYIIADPIVIPEENKQFYKEKIAYLPHTYWVVDSTKEIFKNNFTRPEMELPENGFVFCCFNNAFKITPDIFDIWMRLLQKVDGSVLWLSRGNATSMQNLRNEARTRGISDDRLIFAKRMESHGDHLARQQLADLFLDTFYYNAHTTTSDALWEGLPVLTCLGKTFTSRVAASLLNALNLPELITNSHAEYEARALELAKSPQKLSDIRNKLAQNRIIQPLFNTKIFTKYFEEALIQMIEKSQAGLLPEDIYVPERVK